MLNVFKLAVLWFKFVCLSDNNVAVDLECPINLTPFVPPGIL